MIHIISINKKHFNFFLISLLISGLITLGLQILNNKKLSDNESECSEFIMIQTINKYNSDVLYNYYKLILEKEMIKLVQNNNQIFYKNDRIYFKSENCQKNIKFVLEHLSKIEKEIIIQLKLLINNLENKTFPIHDQVMIFDLEGLDLINVNLSGKVVSNKLVKTIIQFFTAVFLLNFAFYILTKVKFNLK